MRVFVLMAAVVFLLLAVIGGILFVSIVWTHRPDVGLKDFLREMINRL
ncbi:MAG: hypothetical protein IJ708_07815 [Clostridia bacterium]|nr:hypothetical protein [Clostridia bacterium]